MQLLLQLSFLGSPEAVAQCGTAGLIVLYTLLGFIRYIFHIDKAIFNNTCLLCPQSPSILVQCSHTLFSLVLVYLMDSCSTEYVVTLKVYVASCVKITPPAFFNM